MKKKMIDFVDNKPNVFKRGDVIVSGYGNIRIFAGGTGNGKAADGTMNVFYDCLTMYCESDAPAGTDMRYARHATDREKKIFFDTLKYNGLVYDARTCTIKKGPNYKGIETENVLGRKNTKGPRAFKVVKKRVRATLGQIRILESKVSLLDEIISTHVKEKVELKSHLDEVKGCNEKMAKDLAILQEDNEKLNAKNTTLEQSNKLMKDDLDRQKRANENLSAFNDQYKKRITELENRGFWARVFNK